MYKYHMRHEHKKARKFVHTQQRCCWFETLTKYIYKLLLKQKTTNLYFSFCAGHSKINYFRITSVKNTLCVKYFSKCLKIFYIFMLQLRFFFLCTQILRDLPYPVSLQQEV